MEEYRLITSKKELCTKTERKPMMPLTTHDNRTDKNFQVKHVYDRSNSQGKNHDPIRLPGQAFIFLTNF